MGNNNKRKSSAMDMTTGSIPLNILKFSIPLMLAQILEVLFNMSDVAVVGKFSSYEALGAVGSTSLLVTPFIISSSQFMNTNLDAFHNLFAKFLANSTLSM